MPRKRPSVHSEGQFALFLKKIDEAARKADDPAFDAAVNRLIRQHRDGDAAGASANGSPAGKKNGALPDRPDFEDIEKAAREMGDGQNSLLTLIGQLVIGWSNNESLLIYVLMLLLETDERSAAIVFATLNTTRARLDLVRRLMLLKVKSGPVRASVEAIVRRLGDASRARNEFLHAMFSVNEKGQITHTHAMRFVEGRGRYSFGDREPVDQQRLNALRGVRDELRLLNRELWDLLPRLRDGIRERVDGNSTSS